MASRNIYDLDPKMIPLALDFIGRAHDKGIEVLIYCTWRSPEEQAELYAQGRTKPGRIVTWTLNSKHNKTDVRGKPASKAFDCVPIEHGKALWNDKEKYKLLGQIAREVGLRWGGDWDGDGKPFERGEYDSPHFEI